ncbi:MAG: glycoside hydrolase family 95 protein, partial [Luteolibacter sp.]
MSRFLLLSFSLVLVSLAALGQAAAAHQANVLWYAQPARSWMTEALPIGNGSLGGMVFGLTSTERIQFNANTLWTGHEKNTGSYQAFGDVFIQLNHANPTGYRRELDIECAVQRFSYSSSGVNYLRTAFASHPAKVMVVHLSADKAGAHTGRLWLTDMHGAKITAEGNRLTASGRLGRDGLDYESQLLVLNSGGKIRIETAPMPAGDPPLAGVPGTDKTKLPATCLVFEGCSSITLVLAADTNYLADRAQNWRGPAPHAAVTQRVDAAAKQSVKALLDEHVADYQSLFNRFRLDLGATAPALAAKPTDERLIAYTKEKTSDPELEKLFVQYGRYLLISSSRGGLPANLQGLWNDSNSPPWLCDYHSNINVQMNYWPAEPTNLSECHLPFLNYVDSQREVYRLRTREEKDYGPNTRGWTVRTENGIFGGGSFKWNPPGSAWYALHFWEHFAFTRDR